MIQLPSKKAAFTDLKMANLVIFVPVWEQGCLHVLYLFD